MKKFVTLVLACTAAFAFSACHLFAQNLVPNPGFEQYTVCPFTLYGGLNDWSSPSTFSTPDYFNTCATSAEVGIPQNAFGYQYPHGGKAMMGIITWQATHNNGSFSQQSSEYIQAKLTQRLQAGKNYCVTFFVNNAINPNASPSFDRNYIAVDQVGVHFSANKVQSTAVTLGLPYHIMNTTGRYITDTAGWTKISTLYTANGTEQWMTIGVFSNGVPPSHILLDPSSTKSKYHNYLYIDDVSVEMIKPNDTVFSGRDTSYCNPQAMPMTLKSKRNDGVYKWNTGGTDQGLTITKPGSYWCATYTDCRWYIDTINIKYTPNGYLDLPKEAVNCNNSPVVLKPEGKFKTYRWSTNATTDSIVIEKPGKYYLTVTGDCGTQTDTVQVYIQGPTPAPAKLDTTICAGAGEPAINIAGNDIGWYTSVFSMERLEKQPKINTGLLGTRTFYITETIGKCESEKVPIKAYIKYTPKAELERRAEMCEKRPDTLGKQLPDVVYRWSNGYNYCCIIPNQQGKHFVTVSNECGTHTDTVNVEFSLCDTCIHLPNAFTPNNDGRNDVFKALISCPVTDFHMSIYNRWGNLVFETDILDEGWDGYRDFTACDMGTYVYMISYRARSTNKPKLQSGTVLLIK